MTIAQIEAKYIDKRTPVEVAILKIDGARKQSIHQNSIVALSYAYAILDSILENEREAIELAYQAGSKNGYIKGSNHAVGVKGKNEKTAPQSAIDYFTKTYGE